LSANETVYIKFFAQVNGASANALMNAIDQQIAKGKKKIVLLISTPGGQVFHGISIYNFLKGIPVEIETHNFGSIDSIGNIIYVAGSKRFSVPDARFLMHPVSMNFGQNTSLEEKQLEEKLKSLKIDEQNIAKIIGKEVSKTTEVIENDMRERTTLTPDGAKEYGLVHEIKSELFPKGATVISINNS